MIPAALYTDLASEFKALKKKSLSGFIQWVNSIYGSGYNEGWKACKDKYMDTKGGIVVDESLDVEIWREEDLLTLDDVLEAMLAVKGIGSKRAALVIEKLSEDCGGPINTIKGVHDTDIDTNTDVDIGIDTDIDTDAIQL